MEATKKQEIKRRIRNTIESNPKMPMVLEVGFIGSKLSFFSGKAFGKRVLNQIDDNNVNDIVFEGIENKTLSFKTMYHIKDIWSNSRGYGLGKNMGD